MTQSIQYSFTHESLIQTKLHFACRSNIQMLESIVPMYRSKYYIESKKQLLQAELEKILLRCIRGCPCLQYYGPLLQKLEKYIDYQVKHIHDKQLVEKLTHIRNEIEDFLYNVLCIQRQRKFQQISSARGAHINHSIPLISMNRILLETKEQTKN